MNRICKELKKHFKASVKRNLADGILFSGGLDSALVAAYARDATAISVGLMPGAEDQSYANAVAKYLGLDLRYITVTVDEVLGAVPEVVRILRSFDPAIPNDVTVYLGLKHAKDAGVSSMMTGDGSDEIFAGYSFMQKIDDLNRYLSRMHSSMRFNSNRIGTDLGIDIRQPFLDEEFLKFGQGIDLKHKIRTENGTTWGKWILRKAFENVLPRKILWQSKRPLEIGSGMTRLRRIIESTISDEEFEKARNTYPIRFWNKEHL